MKYILILICSLAPSLAYSAESVDINSLTSEELNQLPVETLNPLPAKELFNKMGMEIMYDELIPISLYLLFYSYPTNLPLKKQILAFQSDRGFPETGELTFEQAAILIKSMEALFPTTIYFSGSAEPYMSDDFAFVTGTWTILGDDKIAFPVNESTIRCYKNRSVCEEEAINVTTHELDDSGKRVPKDNYFVSKSDSELNIISWGDTEIIATTEAKCRNTTLTINSSSNEVTFVTRNSGKDCTLLDGSILPPLTQPRVSVMVEGFKTTHAYFQELNTSVSAGWSSRFQERFKWIGEQMQ